MSNAKIVGTLMAVFGGLSTVGWVGYVCWEFLGFQIFLCLAGMAIGMFGLLILDEYT